MGQLLFKFLGHSSNTITPKSRLLSDGQWTHQKPQFDRHFFTPLNRTNINSILLMHRQLVVTQIDIPALLDSWFTKTPLVKILSTNNWLSLHLCGNKTCFIFGLLRVGRVFSLSLKFPGHKTQLIICVISYVISNTSGILLIGKMLDGRRIKKDVGKKVVA